MFHPRTRWKTMSERTPTKALGERGSTSRTDAATIPTTPSTTLTPPKPLPKAGTLSIATPRATKARGTSDMRESAGREHAETHNAQDAPEESGREARPPESTIQGEEVGDPQDEDHQVEAILYRARCSDVGE